MRINNMIEFNETKTNYTPYYLITIITAIVLGYFLIIGGKVLTFLFVLVVQYWWGAIIIVLGVLFLWKKMRSK